MKKPLLFFKKAAGWIAENKAKSIIIGSAFLTVISVTTVCLIVFGGHDHKPYDAVVENVIEASCDVAGSYDEVVYCLDCGEELSRKTNVIDAVGHTEVVDEGVAPDCVTAGLTDGKHCSVCNKEIVAQEMIPAFGHDEITHSAQVPTCTEVGWDAYVTCSRCSYTTYDEKAILGHDEITHVAKVPTCTEVGWDAYVTCSRCSYTTYDEKAVLEHDEITHIAKAPTCTEVGWDAYVTCSRCNYTTYNEKPATGHTADPGTYKAPTCTETGWSVGSTCSVCKVVLEAQQTIPALGHTEVVDPYVAPDCVNAGLTAGKHCSVCKEIITYQTIIDPLGHTEVTDDAVDPDCVNTGLTEGKHCSECGEVLVSQTVLDALGHTEVTDGAVDPDCVNTGLTEGKHCSECGKVLVEQTVLDAEGHNLTSYGEKKATCTEAGWQAYEECSKCDYSTYEEIASLGHDLTYYEAKSVSCINIGWDEYETCSRCEHTTYVEIPMQHKADSFGCCIGCGLPESPSTFHYTLNSDGTYTVTTVGTCRDNDIVIGFYNGKDITAIGNRAFAFFDRIRTVYISDKVTSIGVDAFYECTALTTVNIPKGLTFLGAEAFGNCYSLKSDIVIPDGVTAIGNYTFINCTSLTSVILGKNVTTIGEKAFESCYSLTKLIVPAKLESIGARAFYDCSALKSVYYEGTEEDENYLNLQVALGSSKTAYRYAEELSEDLPCGNYWTYLSDKSIETLIIDHIPAILSSTSPNCVDTGLTEGEYCESCEKILVAQQIIPALGHTETVEYPSVAPTCLLPGLTEQTRCTVCNSVVKAQKDIPATGHFISYVESDQRVVQYYSVANDKGDPFVIAGNLITSTNHGDDSTSTYTITALTDFILRLEYNVSSEETYDDLVIYHNSTVLVRASGSMMPEFKSLEIDLKSGDTVRIRYDKDDDVSSGYDCAYVRILTDISAVEAYEKIHMLPDTEENVNAFSSCTEDLLCAVCAHLILAKSDSDHDYVLHEAKAPTCTEEGYEAYRTCSKCSYSELEAIPPRHDATDNDGKCRFCGLAESTPGLEFRLNTDGTYELKSVGNCREADIVIGFYNGMAVTSIAENALYGCTTIKSVYISDCVTSIGKMVFQNCSELTSVRLPEGLTAIPDYTFTSCKKLSDVKIPDSVVSIGNYAFRYCNELQTVIIPDSVRSIGGYAFASCRKLHRFVIGENVESIGGMAFEYCYMLVEVISRSPSIVVTGGNASYGYLGSYALSVFNHTDEIVISNIIVDEGYVICRSGDEYILSGYIGADRDLILPQYVTKINKYAFYNCFDICTIVIGDSVTEIGYRSFYNCYNMVSVTIGKNVSTITMEAFTSCYKLAEVLNRSSHLTIRNNTNDYTGYYAVIIDNSANASTRIVNDNGYLIITIGTDKILVGYLGDESELELPSYITKIGNYAFYRNKTITDVVIPTSVKSIGRGAFYYCSGISKIDIPYSVVTIGNLAFYECSGLSEITIGSGVTSIGIRVFEGCDMLVNVTFDDTTTWYRTDSETYWNNQSGGSQVNVGNAKSMATMLARTHSSYYWYKK